MIKGKQLLGLSIVGQADGKHLGTIRDLIFDHDTDELLALVVSDKDLFGLIDAQVIPWAQIRSIGGDVVIVENEGSKIKLKDDPRLSQAAQRETMLSGTKVLSGAGEQLGTLADMCIDETTGHVLGYEVSKGFIADTLRGKKFVATPPGLVIGSEAAIAPPAAEQAIKK